MIQIVEPKFFWKTTNRDELWDSKCGSRIVGTQPSLLNANFIVAYSVIGASIWTPDLIDKMCRG